MENLILNRSLQQNKYKTRILYDGITRSVHGLVLTCHIPKKVMYLHNFDKGTEYIISFMKIKTDVV